MSEQASGRKSMDEIMALCKRRGFVFQASEIYGGINGFWDYGPLGAQLKKNLREAWWEDVVMRPVWGREGPDGERVRIVPVDTCIIQHPKVWEASGHVAGFNDPRVDCKACKARFRADHVTCVMYNLKWEAEGRVHNEVVLFSGIGDKDDVIRENAKAIEKAKRAHSAKGWPIAADAATLANPNIQPDIYASIPCPNCGQKGTLTEARQFNLMFPTYVGATATEEDKAYLRPETAQGIFVNFKNVVDTTRVRVPFGVGQTGKAFRNEVTPRNFTFRSREFEQMEVEFFCHESEAMAWYAFWRDWRMEWWRSIGLGGDNLVLREHETDELAHYSKATSDIEYRFPFTSPGFGELEGVAYRGCYDLQQHATHSGAKLEYFDQERNERFLPHVIEPSAGLDRGVLALLCEAYTPDETRASKVFMKFHPRMAPIKAAVFPLVNKDGMPEAGRRLHDELSARFGRTGLIEFDAKQSIGKRYARMDEAGCPFCFTIDGQTLEDQTVTVRDRDTQGQERIAMSGVVEFLAQRLV